MTFICGCDLGEANDWTALVIVEQTEIANAPATARFRYDIRHVDRVRRIGWDKIALRVRDLVERLGEEAPLILDYTGAGRPAATIFEMVGIRAPITLVTITAGNAVVERSPYDITVPKRDLASVVAVTLQTDRLHIGPKVPLARALMAELSNFRVKVSLSGHESFEAWREKDHDDMVLATALAVWYGELAGPPLAMSQVSFGFDGGGGPGWGNAPSSPRRNPWD
jgi:hypothetical protein